MKWNQYKASRLANYHVITSISNLSFWKSNIHVNITNQICNVINYDSKLTLRAVRRLGNNLQY